MTIKGDVLKGEGSGFLPKKVILRPQIFVENNIIGGQSVAESIVRSSRVKEGKH